MKRALVAFAFALLLMGCITQADLNPSATPLPSSSAAVTATAAPSATPDASATPQASPTGSVPSPYPSEAATAAPTAFGPNSAPSISTSASPSNPDRGQVFKLEVSSQDDLGVKSLHWESTDAFSAQPSTNSFDCGGQKNCSVLWEFACAQDGSKTITVYSIDSYGVSSARQPIQITVRPFDYKPRPSPSPSPSATPLFACANGKCEGGESYQSCPQDCSASSAVGASCGDGACSPGEDAANCASDCSTIKPNCGNNACDAGETATNCSADCSPTEPSCSSNSACGYKQICQSGKCVSVDCTNDAQCGYAKECEGNRCVRCPSGPYGPAC